MNGSCVESDMDQDQRVLEKYFNLWSQNAKKLKVKSKKVQIAAFLQRLVQEKEKLSFNDEKKRVTSPECFDRQTPKSLASKNNYSTAVGNYLHRYQAQKNIIALQKTKLDEQKRFIEELKLNKILKDVSSLDTFRNEIKSSLSKCSNVVKPKMKWIIAESTPSESTSNESIRLDCMKVPKFYLQMEQRARERQEKRAMVMERRRQKELERERINEQKELAKQNLQKEELEKRMNEFKERRRQEQLLAIKRKQYREKMRILIVMADLHYEKKLAIKYGPATWRLFVQRVKEDRIRAEQFNKLRIMRINFQRWSNITRKIMNAKIQKADCLYHTKLKIDFLIELKKLHMNMVYKKQTAEDWYDFTLLLKTFLEWRNIVQLEQSARLKKWNMAVQHYECQLKWRVIGCWETLPTINALERKHEARKQRWRLRVQEVLPDYIPRDY